MRTTPRRAVVVMFLALPLVTLSGACSGGTGSKAGSTPTLKGVTRTTPLTVASVSLPTATAAATPMTMTANAGQLLLVYFGYTSCPDICPTTMSDLRVAVDGLPTAERERVRVALVTVDPERDTDAVLTAYVQNFFSNGIALRTADETALGAAAKAFGVRFQVAAHAPGAEYRVSHSAVTYVVDEHGTVVDEWPFGMATKDMTADLRTLLAGTAA